MCDNALHRRLVVGLLALELASLLLACQPSDPWTSDNPTYALNAFFSALRTGDDDTVEAFLSQPTLAFLEATRQDQLASPGSDTPDVPTRPADLIYRVWTPAATDIDHLETLDRNNTTATVAVHSVFGDVQHVTLHRTDGRWTIDLLPEPIGSPDIQTP